MAAASATFCWSRRWTIVRPPSMTRPVIAMIATRQMANRASIWPRSAAARSSWRRAPSRDFHVVVDESVDGATMLRTG